MRTIPINASRQYEVQIGSGLLSSLGERVRAVFNGKTIAIVTDSNVQPLYLEKVRKSLFDGGFRNFCTFVVAAGEESKSGAVYLELLNFLAQHHITRSDLLIALGGGVVGDLTGFAAATYLRGISFIQIPTTLLAAVDSSVGGKTAIDLPAGKNLAGAFYQPALVVCDTDTLHTLPPEIFRDGCAEVIKYAVLYDEALFSHLETQKMDFHREDVIARCVELKRDVVCADEFDRGARQKLNLGHTMGHGVETLSHFAVSHGQAVAIGTAIAARAAAKRGLCSLECAARVECVLEAFGLPIRTEFSAEALANAALSDKKRDGDTVNLILPEKIGFCRIQPLPVTELQALIAAGV